MPIVRTYGCADCGHTMDVVLSMDQVDDPPPDCPRCAAMTHQEFKPVALGGSAMSRAAKLAEDIIENDYKAANVHFGNREGDQNKVTYKDQSPNLPPAAFESAKAKAQEYIAAGAAIGSQTRKKYGDGLDVLKSTLKDGTQPDLIEVSKARSIKVW